MSVQATPQRQSTSAETAQTTAAENVLISGKSPRSPFRSPRSPHSPKTPKKSLTPLTKYAIQMSTTPIRNRLLLTPTKNKQRHIYDPFEDLKILGKLFNSKSKSRSKSKSKSKSKNLISNKSLILNNNSSPINSILDIDDNINDNNNNNNNEMNSILTDNNDNDDNNNNSMNNSILNLNNKPSLLISNKLSISPTPEMKNIPSFINKDVRSFAKFVHNQSSSFITNIPSIDMSDSSYFDDTVQLTQSQSQSQSQVRSQSQSQLQSQIEKIPYNDNNPAEFDDGMEDYSNIDNEIGRFNDTTFESHADTSNIAFPEAILRNGSGILGLSDDDDDEIDEYNLSLNKLNESDYSSNDSENSSDELNDNLELINSNDTIINDDLSLIKQREQFITKRKKHKNNNNKNNNIIKESIFSNKLIKGLFENLQVNQIIGSSEIDNNLFNELSNKFIDIELNKTIKMSEFTGLKDRIVYTDLINNNEINNYEDNNINKAKENEEEEESILLYAMHNWDIESVKELEGVLYSNNAMRKRRANFNLLDQTIKVKEVERKDDGNDNENGNDDDDYDDYDNLSKLKSHITFGIAEDSDNSSDYEIPFEEEEEDDDEKEE
ncbi:hypothetical protein C6P40_003994 [Pichia californica]|uniref:Uncharacterized protein n=1 Tax=Pichia californica TaxID=460514 RepID=A0A9P6WI38_9ASCO|nr:hypothetical protein C6P42_003469 [[Candida] californica]KAG0686473.1 hypothetical protein C6P40_003994 [[Candida] californica]